MEDSGALPIEMDVTTGVGEMGRVIDINIKDGIVTDHETGEQLTTFELKTPVIKDEVRAGGRIPLIVGKGLTNRCAPLQYHVLTSSAVVLLNRLSSRCLLGAVCWVLDRLQCT